MISAAGLVRAAIIIGGIYMEKWYRSLDSSSSPRSRLEELERRAMPRLIIIINGEFVRSLDSSSSPRSRQVAGMLGGGGGSVMIRCVWSYRGRFLELHWKTLIFFERAVPISPNAR